ncbi:MAG: CDP-glycerol glycerophosphotransferase, partial [Actinomycetota bacterium]|nr:CDP-glycerol glycerophosphotransferase [Actinomycetota bacterium]
MRRFTFSSGNARKILALPLYALGALASMLVSRRSGLWVFGSGIGVGEGALALLAQARAANPRLRTVWLARDDRDLRDAAALGIRAVRKSSWRGFRLTLRAEVIVVTHGFGDANRFATHGGFVVQLWHGVPFKHIHLDSPATLRVPVLSSLPLVRSLLRRVYERSANGYRMFAAASPLSAARIRSAFALPADRVVVTGDPRDDVLFVGTAVDRREKARQTMAGLLGDASLSSSRILLYAPTWRDGDPDPAIPAADGWRRIGEYLEATDSILIVRSHPLGVGDYAGGVAASPRVRLLGSDLLTDITPILTGVDVLVTDYSSIAYDFALVGGEIVFLAPDVAEYAASRGLYEPYADFSGGTEVATWDAALELLQASASDDGVRRRLLAHTDWLATRVHTFHDGRSAARVFDEIVSRLEGTTIVTVDDSGLDVDTLLIGDGATPVVTISGAAGTHAPTTVRLGGSRLQLPGSLEVLDGRWTATIPLLTSRWSGPALPPPTGRYRVRISGTDGRPVTLNLTAAVPEPVTRAGLFRLSVGVSGDGITLDFSAPLDDSERGSAQQSRLEAAYRSAKEPLENAVFFESYFGQNASCNPRGIDAALRRIRPDITRYWSVTDASVEVPQGAIAVIEGSSEWWRARASARLLVVNDWLRKRYRSKRGQTVLQTWHGTPLKRIALDRREVRPRTAVATWLEKSRWNIMLAQNQFSADTFRSAYSFKSPIWQEGYPRNDVLVTGNADELRARLGIPAGKTVVLYAPTWRDDRPGKVDHLDVASFSRELGPDFVILIRGHSRTMQPGIDVRATGVVDVTGYPDISELFLVADALVTDYSSVMFDFTVTGKP